MSKKLYVTTQHRNLLTNHTEEATHILDKQIDIDNFERSNFAGASLFFYKVEEPFKSGEKVVERSIAMHNIIKANKVETYINTLTISRIEIFKDILLEQRINISNIKRLLCKITLSCFANQTNEMDNIIYHGCKVIEIGTTYHVANKIVLSDIVMTYEEKSLFKYPTSDEKIKDDADLTFMPNCIFISIDDHIIGLINNLKEN